MDDNALRCLSPVKRVKIQNWIQIIHACMDSGLTNEEFCKQNDINLKSYYYYLAKIRKMKIEELPYKNRKPQTYPAETVFAEVEYPQASLPTSSVVVRKKDLSIEIPETISDDFLSRILEALKC